jgi:hypothetical protein
VNKLYKYLRLFAIIAFAPILVSCNNYGKKVTFAGNKGEVYYKGDSVTDADAKATGQFLQEQEYFLNDDKGRSVQISRENGIVTVRFVVDEKALEKIPNADQTFELLGAMMSRQIFKDTPVKVIYSDDEFRDIKTLPQNPAMDVKAAFFDETRNMKKKPYFKNTLYYSSDINNANADSISEYLVKSGFFSKTGNIDLFVTKEGSDGFHIRFIIQAAYANAEGFNDVDNFAKQMKKDLFANVPLVFEIMDENMTSLKILNY